MVQVDIFWSYALGAGMAMAAARQIEKEPEAPKGGWFNCPYFTYALLYLAVLFAPSGVCLLWAFPSWETMHVGDRNLPAWLVTGFAVTNITQGILGFWITYRLIRAGKRFAGALQVVLGYFLMFFILVHGWDGAGYRRFFSATKADFLAWQPSNVLHWFQSNVAIALYLMGIVLIPVLMGLMSRWLVEGAKEDPECSQSNLCHITAVRRILTLIFGAGLGTAIIASLFIHLLGWIFGTAIFFVLAYLILLRPKGLLSKFVDRIYFDA
jgi:hypothetical protein